MKLLHLSDLHLGKRVNDYSMIEDQEYIIRQILEITDKEKPDAVIIAGDVYDKAVPSAEAVVLLDYFLTALAARKLQVYIISGNHDSADRMGFGSKLMESSGIHLAKAYDGNVAPIEYRDMHGTVNIYMLPFIKPVIVRGIFPEECIESYTDAVRVAINHMDIDESDRNVLITHQFVTGASRSDSEEISVGGSDNVDASVFEAFDYVALGHIHGPQNVGSRKVRYCGTPLKYSFSEVNHHKSVTIVELESKGEMNIRTKELIPKHDMIELKGTYLELTDRNNYEKYDREAYIRIILTDEEEEPEAMSKLRLIYPNIMNLLYDNKRTRGMGITYDDIQTKQGNPIDIFSELYEKQNSSPMSEVQTEYMKELIEQIWG